MATVGFYQFSQPSHPSHLNPNLRVRQRSAAPSRSIASDPVVPEHLAGAMAAWNLAVLPSPVEQALGDGL